jgi:hypothetical protein
MNAGVYRYALLISVGVFGCKYKLTDTESDSYRRIESPEQCFKAIFQKDSAVLKFKTLPNGKILGRLFMKYGEPEPLAKEKNTIAAKSKGQFNKDTLFADYVFTDGSKKTVYKNPLALLRNGDKLMLGFGPTMNYLGHTCFSNTRQSISLNAGFNLYRLNVVIRGGRYRLFTLRLPGRVLK